MTARDKRLYHSGAVYRAAKIDPIARPSQNFLAKYWSLAVVGAILITAFVIVIQDAMKGGK